MRFLIMLAGLLTLFLPAVSMIILTVDQTTCPSGRFSAELKAVRGSYECGDFQGSRWIKPFGEGLMLYRTFNVEGDFSLEFSFYAFRPGCPYVRVTLFGDKVLSELKRGSRYALGGPSFVSIYGSCDRFEAGISQQPKEADSMYEYRRKIAPETVHRVRFEVSGGAASIYLDGRKIAVEPFNAISDIRGVGIYFYKRIDTDKPYADYPALLGDLKIALLGKRGQVVSKPSRGPEPPIPVQKTASPQPMPVPVAKTPPPPPPLRTSGPVKCIDSVGVGEASVIGGDRAGAKVEATARAKWDAIEKALGVTTSVKTILHNFRLLDEVIKNEVGGFIRGVKTLKVENFQDMVRVKVKGCVYPKEAERALSLISSDTAFSVMILTKNPRNVGFDEMNPVTTELINILNQQGYRVYDFAGNPNINPYDVENIIAQRRFIALRAYMSRVLSGAIIVGKVELVPSTRAGQDIGYGISSPFNVVTARLNYYLLTRDRDGLRIIASGSLSAMGRAPNETDAGYRAMEALAKRLGSDIIGKLEKYRASKKKVVSVTVKGVKSTRVNFKIKEKLQRVPWVESVEDMGLGRFRVRYLENTVYLANAVERIPELKLISFNPAEVVAKYE